MSLATWVAPSQNKRCRCVNVWRGAMARAVTCVLHGAGSGHWSVGGRVALASAPLAGSAACRCSTGTLCSQNEKTCLFKVFVPRWFDTMHAPLPWPLPHREQSRMHLTMPSNAALCLTRLASWPEASLAPHHAARPVVSRGRHQSMAPRRPRRAARAALPSRPPLRRCPPLPPNPHSSVTPRRSRSRASPRTRS